MKFAVRDDLKAKDPTNIADESSGPSILVAGWPTATMNLFAAERLLNLFKWRSQSRDAV